MPFQVTIKPSGHQFQMEAGETLLESAAREGFTLRHSCRNGACGSCKGKILEGQVDYGQYQANALSESEKQAGMALFCTATPLSDVMIECKEVGAARDIPIKTMPCRVQTMLRLAPDVMELHLKLPANERLEFLAGQYIDILLKDGKRRSFSLANAPNDDAFLQLHVRHVPGGLFTDTVFGQMEEKTILRFDGPHGSFYLRDDSDKPILFMAGGTGFAPIKSMLEQAFQTHSKRQMVLYWGAHSLKDLYMGQLAGQWQETHPNFTFIPVLSEPQPEDHWPGRTGLVHQAILDDFDTLEGFQVYACGAPQMVEAGRSAFLARGLPEEAFFADAFTFSPG
ncbi:MAG: CDP-6-deoxy-delta-3,4-glucoseen reductase [Sulfuricellaceae bacterium]|nr:CDP-6-deoxy-delta-3,4-glucoseen reductase [Sulfuricellaceae bacterium]